MKLKRGDEVEIIYEGWLGPKRATVDMIPELNGTPTGAVIVRPGNAKYVTAFNESELKLIEK